MICVVNLIVARGENFTRRLLLFKLLDLSDKDKSKDADEAVERVEESKKLIIVWILL